VRLASSCIKSIHRNEPQQAEQLLKEARQGIAQMLDALRNQPALRYGGFVGDAEKEYAEAAITEELEIDYAPWLNGLAEAGGEFRRHVLDLIREDHPEQAEEYLEAMSEIYHTIMGFDYPNAISYGLRGRSDALRSMIERTRGDLTNALRQARLEQRLAQLEETLSHKGGSIT